MDSSHESGQRQKEEAQMSGFLLDTHAWLWAQMRNTKEVPAKFFTEVEKWQRQRTVYISAISVLELARLVAHGSLSLGTSIDRFVEDATRNGGFQLLALDVQILIESTRLPGNIHRDPSDRLLVATAREHSLTLITVDRDILDYAARGHLNARKP
jgi:PIN domain nuclease of toxin-antitoxin system